MNRIRHHRVSRWVARFLALAMTVSTLAGFGTRRAEAQVGVIAAPSFGIPKVYLLDFNNKTPIGGSLLGRVASSQVALALLDSGNWEVASDDVVQGRIQALDLRAPFDRVARAQIATGLDADGVIYGWVTEARVTANPAQAFVRLQVVVEDVRNGVLMSGAIASGESQPRVGFAGDADVLLEEALARAAFRVREQLDRFQLPQGTILNTSVLGETTQVALLNVGIRQGVRRGMEFIVLRLGQMVGRVRATAVDADLCNARIIENLRGVRPEDKVRAIFTFQDFPGDTGQRRRSSNELAPGHVRLAARDRQIEARLASEEEPPSNLLAMGGQEGAQPGGAPPVIDEEPDRGGGRRRESSSVKLLVGGALLFGILAIGGSKGGTSAFGTEARAVQLAPGSPTGIRVSWKRPRQVLPEQVLQFILWRSNPGGLGAIQVVGGVNGDVIHSFDDADTSVHDVDDVFDGAPGFGFRVPDQTNEAGSRTTFADVPGLVAGQKYRYQVATAWLFEGDLDGDGVPDSEEVMGPLSDRTPSVTFLLPPTIIDPINTSPPTLVDLTDLTVEFNTVDGGNIYALVVSDDGGFGAGEVVVAATKSLVPPDLGGPTQDRFENISVPTRKFRNDRFVFLSIGVRNRDDRLAPAPNGFIFSAPVQVENAGFAPPPPPGRAQRGGKQNRNR